MAQLRSGLCLIRCLGRRCTRTYRTSSPIAIPSDGGDSPITSSPRPRSEVVGGVALVDPKEAAKFSYGDWWVEGGSARPLHALNLLRVPLVRNALLGRPYDDLSPLERDSPYPLEGKRVLDIGCGAGILCEPLARLGADVTGIDPSPSNVAVASDHASLDPEVAGRVAYRSCSVEELGGGVAGAEQYDAVVASEVVEHVPHLHAFVAELAPLVKPGGAAVFTTINRTGLSFLLAILAAEHLLRVLPRGSHSWDKLVSPDELSDSLRHAGMETRFLRGTSYNPFTSQWAWSWGSGVNYALAARKPV